MWEAYWEVIKGMDRLQTSQISLSVCMTCLQAAESANHLFLHFESANDRLLRLLGLCWVISFSVEDAIAQEMLLFISKRAKPNYIYISACFLVGCLART